MIIQTSAIFLDSFRYLRSRYLFWIVLVISAISAAALFGTYSFTDDGIKVLWFKPINNPDLARGTDGREVFIAYIFNSYFARFWLGWGAMILALISTSSLLPDFLGGGSIELSLSKPIGRWQLFITKFFSGMLFVLVQLSIAVGLAYLIIGIRFDLWIHSALLAIPLLTLQFLYLYSISAFISVMTRSTIATLLGTLVVWLLIFLAQLISNGFVKQSYSLRELMTTTEQRIERIEAFESERPLNSREQRLLDTSRENMASYESTYEFVYPWAKKSQRLIFFVPKTGDLQRYLAAKVNAPVSNEFFGLFIDFSSEEFRPSSMDETTMKDSIDAENAADKALRQVSLRTSILSSLTSCAVLLGLGIWRFSRRDY